MGAELCPNGSAYESVQACPRLLSGPALHVCAHGSCCVRHASTHSCCVKAARISTVSAQAALHFFRGKGSLTCAVKLICMLASLRKSPVTASDPVGAYLVELCTGLGGTDTVTALPFHTRWACMID